MRTGVRYRYETHRFNRLRFPATVIVAGDGIDNAPLNAAYSSLPSTWVEDASSPAQRHVLNNRSGANYNFADGHTKWIHPEGIGSNATGVNEFQTFALR